MKPGLFNLLLPLLLIYSFSVNAQQDLRNLSLARDRNVPPPEWNIYADKINKREPTVKDILGRTAKIYGNLRTYQDKSVSLSTTAGQNTYMRMESVTLFDKTMDKFRLETWLVSPSNELHQRFVMWKDKAQIKNWTKNNNTIYIYPSIDLAISNGAYLSHRASSFVPKALFSEIADMDNSWTSSVGKHRISDITENEVSYFRVQFSGGATHDNLDKYYIKTTYWIRKEDALLIRVVQERADKDLKFSSYQVIQYEPTINEPIPESAFEFGH